MFYKIDRQQLTIVDVYRIGFAEPAANDDIVKEVERLLNDIVGAEGVGGKLALLNGPASLPVAVQLGHALHHRYAAIGVFDPKMAAYVVVVTHGPDYKVGDVIPTSAVK